ncbi:unnamed protein product [Rhizophagus irregularis]|uniref:Uncharacterized protein n=1 Tax=Rhizophagus irregularis TaxID=588596 RepID=A0A2I1G3N1_9GLOM|nr:hypothetical protein RhiirA4_416484 [Rhizophagus irregularis]CAB4414748.1 unnamed protein product [Rhizophagus irregularis]
MVNKWRLNEEMITEDHPKMENQEKTLRKDNVDPEAVVNIIKDFRTKTLEIKYKKLKDNATDLKISRKANEIQEIFKEKEMTMEWEAINQTAIERLQKEENINPGMEEFCKWMRKEQKNFIAVQKKIVTIAEEQDPLDHYIKLNNDFTQRLEDEN